MDFQTSLEAYIAKLTEASKKDFETNFPSLEPPVYSFQKGRKNVKIVVRNCGQNSVFCFVEIATGNILKAASWKAPAEGVRGNIYNENLPLSSGSLYRY